jgi:hypothetical protein
MDSISVPILSAASSVDDAIAALDLNGVSALAVLDPALNRIVFGGELEEAKSRARTQLDAVRGEALGVPDLAGIESRYGDLNAALTAITSVGTPSPVDRTLWGLVNTDYALASSTGASAVIVTTSETLANGIRTTARLKCNGPIVHFFPRPHVAPGGLCTKCITPPRKPLPTVGPV